jgi:PAS domain S-box-containing protein
MIQPRKDDALASLPTDSGSAGGPRYRHLLETAFEGICSLDAALRIDSLNQRLAELLGAPPADLLGRPLLEYVHPRSVEAARAHLALIGQGGREQRELTFRRRDGTDLPALVSSSAVLGDGGRFEAALCMITDLTDYRRLEEQFRQAQKLEAIGRLASGIAHDFNNLLTAITGYADLLLAELAPDDPHRQDIEQISRAADRAAGLTAQLLAFSRRQISQTDLVDLNQVLHDTERMLRRLLGEDVEFATLPGRDLGRIRADPAQIAQVLMNLVVNSRDAMPRGGTVTIETANVTLEARALAAFPHLEPGPYVMLAVTDTGTGMDAETRARAFEPFFTTKEPGRGTGLGLAAVYGIVQQHGGAVQIESEVDAGTTIRIYFPRSGEADARPGRPALAATPGGTETILVVEDEPDLRLLIHRLLGRLGYNLLEARHGRDALLLLREHAGDIHLLLTDVVMPELSGPELVREARRLRPGLRVLYMSGYTEAERLGQGLRDTPARLIQKPFSARLLAQRVREVLDASPPGGEAPAPPPT